MAKRKNVLLILSDQQRMDTISAYGMNDICTVSYTHLHTAPDNCGAY